MNKFFVSALASAGLVAVGSAASQAQDVTYALLTNTAYTTTGVTPASTSSPNPNINDQFVADYTGASNTYFTPTNIVLGDDDTSIGNLVGGTHDNTYATFTQAASPVSFEFEIDPGATIGGSAQTIEVTGYIGGMMGGAGTVGYSSTGVHYSTASVFYTGIQDLTAPGAVVNLSAFDPAGMGTTPAMELTTTIDGVSVSVWVDKTQQKAAPGESVNHTGYIESAVLTTPEPGSVAMIVGMGVSGGLFLRRKRRA